MPAKTPSWTATAATRWPGLSAPSARKTKRATSPRCTSLYLNDLADVIKGAVDERFEFVRYAESLASSQPIFEPLAAALAARPTLIDDLLIELTLAAIERQQPTLVLLSVPFPGAVYAALRMGEVIKMQHPGGKIAMGGSYVNTELRELTEPRVFDFVDFVDFVDLVTLDAGRWTLASAPCSRSSNTCVASAAHNACSAPLCATPKAVCDT